HWWHVAAVRALEIRELRRLARRGGLDLRPPQARCGDHVVAKRDHAGCDGTERELRLPRDPQLARDDDVQRCVESLGDPGGHRDAAARQAEDDRIAQPLTAQTLAERTPGMDPIAECNPIGAPHTPCPPHRDRVWHPPCTRCRASHIRGRAQMANTKKTVEVQVPIRSAYDQWTQFEEFPRFMD